MCGSTAVSRFSRRVLVVLRRRVNGATAPAKSTFKRKKKKLSPHKLLEITYCEANAVVSSQDLITKPAAGNPTLFWKKQVVFYPIVRGDLRRWLWCRRVRARSCLQQHGRRLRSEQTERRAQTHTSSRPRGLQTWWMQVQSVSGYMRKNGELKKKGLNLHNMLVWTWHIGRCKQMPFHPSKKGRRHSWTLQDDTAVCIDWTRG